MDELIDCCCDTCVGACNYKPGWFMHGEAEKAAELLNMSLTDFFRQKLMVDWWEGGGDIFLLSPATAVSEVGSETPADPRGKCIFLTNGLCEIHKAKPYECRQHIHNEGKDAAGLRKQKIVASWKDNQAQIRGLLGREPESSEFTDSPLGFLFGF